MTISIPCPARSAMTPAASSRERRSRTTSSIGRPSIPPSAFTRSAAICTPCELRAGEAGRVSRDREDRPDPDRCLARAAAEQRRRERQPEQEHAEPACPRARTGHRSDLPEGGRLGPLRFDGTTGGRRCRAGARESRPRQRGRPRAQVEQGDERDEDERDPADREEQDEVEAAAGRLAGRDDRVDARGNRGSPGTSPRRRHGSCGPASRRRHRSA